jgi:hypothetical protein
VQDFPAHTVCKLCGGLHSPRSVYKGKDKVKKNKKQEKLKKI